MDIADKIVQLETRLAIAESRCNEACAHNDEELANLLEDYSATLEQQIKELNDQL